MLAGVGRDVVLVLGALAALLTVVDLVVLIRYDIDWVWAVLQVPVVLLAWTAPVAWSQERWVLAGVGLLASLFGLWGYLYLPPLLVLVLAGVAFTRAVRRTESA